MAIDATEERVFPLSQAPKYAEPIIGRRLNQSTLYRWANKGCKGVRLETRLLGGTRYSSVEALQRFFDALTAAADARRTVPIASAPTRDRRAEIRRANAELDEAGF